METRFSGVNDAAYCRYAPCHCHGRRMPPWDTRPDLTLSNVQHGKSCMSACGCKPGSSTAINREVIPYLGAARLRITRCKRSWKSARRRAGQSTWAKLIGNSDTQTAFLEGSTSGTIQNWNNISAGRSLASYDVTHRLVVSYVVDCRRYTVGQRQEAVRQCERRAGPDRVIGGWGINGVSTLQSGFPLAFIGQPTTLNRFFGAGAPRPDVIAGCPKNLDGSAQKKLAEWFNTACFAQPNAFGYGSEGRTDPNLRSAGIANCDFSVFKRTSITERVSLQFRTEIFNLFNRAIPIARSAVGDRAVRAGERPAGTA